MNFENMKLLLSDSLSAIIENKNAMCSLESQKSTDE
jgi:hypothetical protein